MLFDANAIAEIPEDYDEQTRERLFDEAARRAGWRYQVATVATPMLVIAGTVSLVDWLLPNVPGWVRGGLSLVLIFPTIVWLRGLAVRHFSRRVWSILRERGVDLCIHCAYSLEGLDCSVRYPECGGVTPKLGVGSNGQDDITSRPSPDRTGGVR